MSNEPRYNDKLTFSEYRIAACDEIDLEFIVWDERDPSDEWLRRYHEADRAALREIERLKLAGTYEIERARLAAYLEPPNPVHERLAQRIENGEFEPMRNFSDGLRSPDIGQRERFERLYEEAELADKTPREFWHILLCLEKAKKPKGRPGVSPPWRNAVGAMDAMRFAVAGGATVPQAARDAAAKEGRVAQDNRAKYFEKLYRQRSALRE